ncbi:hypothetical protein PG984_013057 [Apiospora sp. TS-2023a]
MNGGQKVDQGPVPGEVASRDGAVKHAGTPAADAAVQKVEVLLVLFGVIGVLGGSGLGPAGYFDIAETYNGWVIVSESETRIVKVPFLCGLFLVQVATVKEDVKLFTCQSKIP